MKQDPNQNWWMEIDTQFDFEEFEGFKAVKQVLQDNEDLPVPRGSNGKDDEEFYNRLHDKIMKGIENKKIQPSRRSVWQRHRHLIKRTAVASLVLLFVFLGRKTSQMSNTNDSTAIALSDAVHRTENIESSILVYQHKDDFLVDLARESLEHLNVSNLRKLIGSDKVD